MTVASVAGATEANGTWTVTKIDDNTFDLDGSSSPSSYTSGGTANASGLYFATHSLASADGYELGESYIIRGLADIGSDISTDTDTFQVT